MVSSLIMLSARKRLLYIWSIPGWCTKTHNWRHGMFLTYLDLKPLTLSWGVVIIYHEAQPTTILYCIRLSDHCIVRLLLVLWSIEKSRWWFQPSELVSMIRSTKWDQEIKIFISRDIWLKLSSNITSMLELMLWSLGSRSD